MITVTYTNGMKLMKIVKNNKVIVVEFIPGDSLDWVFSNIREVQ